MGPSSFLGMVLEKWGAAWLGDREGRVAGCGGEWGAVRCRAGRGSPGSGASPERAGGSKSFQVRTGPHGGQGRGGRGRRGQRRGCAAGGLGAAGSPGAERKRGGPEPPGGSERLAPVPRPRERASAQPGPRRARPRERASRRTARARARARAARMPVTSAPSAAAREPAPASRENRRQTAL